MDINEIKPLVELNLSIAKISDILKTSKSSIQYWLKKFNLKTNGRRYIDADSSKHSKYKAYTKSFLESMQKDIDLGLNYKELREKYKICFEAISRLNKTGKIKVKNRSDSLINHYLKNGTRKLSEETKQKISKGRTLFLEKNPDKVPYIINHSSRESYPERLFREMLIAHNVESWEQEYRNGIYRYDFAIPHLKIDIEIDGGTHKNPKVQKIDKKRDIWSESQGWHVIRFEAKDIKRLEEFNIASLKKLILKLSNLK